MSFFRKYSKTEVAPIICDLKKSSTWLYKIIETKFDDITYLEISFFVSDIISEKKLDKPHNDKMATIRLLSISLDH